MRQVEHEIERNIEISVSSESTEAKRIQIKKSDLVPLPTDNEEKLVTHDQFEIISVGQEIDPVYHLSQRAGWNQTPADLTALVSQPDSYNLLGVYNINGKAAPLGSGLVVDIGALAGWISMLLVHPELRRQGIGLAILKQCLTRARINLNKQVIGLDATPMGMPIYRNMGFQPSFRLWRCLIGTATNPTGFDPDDFIPINKVGDYRTLLSDLGADQKIVSLALVHKMYPAGCWAVKANNTITGLVLSRPGRQYPYIGPLLAVHEDAAKTLLSHALKYWHQQGHNVCVLDVPENHFATASRWEHGQCVSSPSGFNLMGSARPARVLTRMYELPSSTTATLEEDSVYQQEYVRQLDESAQVIRKYMEAELAGLKFLYASGGPEIG